MPKKLYFGHPINTYNTDLEEKILEIISNAFPGWEIENPNQKKHQDGYTKWRKKTGNGMRYFTEVILPSCRGGIFLAFRDGKWGAGVIKEANYFLQKGLPAYEVMLNLLITTLEEFPANRTLSINETRERIRDSKGNPLPY